MLVGFSNVEASVFQPFFNTCSCSFDKAQGGVHGNKARAEATCSLVQGFMSFTCHVSTYASGLGAQK